MFVWYYLYKPGLNMLITQPMPFIIYVLLIYDTEHVLLYEPQKQVIVL